MDTGTKTVGGYMIKLDSELHKDLLNTAKEHSDLA